MRTTYQQVKEQEVRNALSHCPSHAELVSPVQVALGFEKGWHAEKKKGGAAYGVAPYLFYIVGGVLFHIFLPEGYGRQHPG